MVEDRDEGRVGDPTPPTEPKPQFWYGKDAVVGADVTVSSLGAIIPIVIGNGVLPEFTRDESGFSDWRAYLGMIKGLSVATRSRFAQLGLEVLQNAGTMFAHYIENRQSSVWNMPARVHATKFGGRDLFIPKGSSIFGFYQPGERIVGEELAGMMGNDIKIEGGYRFVYKTSYTKNPEDITGIAVPIREGERYYIPHDPNPIDISEVSNAVDYRAVLRTYYKPVPRQSSVGIWFGTLPETELSERVAIELDEEIAPSLNVSSDVDQSRLAGQYPNGRHIGARLLHPGSGLNHQNSGWPIKVEIDTRGSVQRPGCVIFRPMRTNGVQIAA